MKRLIGIAITLTFISCDAAQPVPRIVKIYVMDRNSRARPRIHTINSLKDIRLMQTEQYWYTPKRMNLTDEFELYTDNSRLSGRHYKFLLTDDRLHGTVYTIYQEQPYIIAEYSHPLESVDTQAWVLVLDIAKDDNNTPNERYYKVHAMIPFDNGSYKQYEKSLRQIKVPW